MALIKNTDTPAEAEERARVNRLVRERLRQSAMLARKLAETFQEGSDYLRVETAADGGPLVPDAEHIASSAAILACLEKLNGYIEMLPGATCPG